MVLRKRGVFSTLVKIYDAEGVWVIQPLASVLQKIFNQLNLLLIKVRSLRSSAHYFQWFTGYLNHIGLLMSHVATCFKKTTLLFDALLCCFVDLILCPTDKYMSKVTNKKIRLICWMCSKLKINTAWHSSGVFIIDFDHSQHINILFLLWTLNKYLSAGCERQFITFWKHKKRCVCFVIKVSRPISFNDLSLHRIEIN